MGANAPEKKAADVFDQAETRAYLSQPACLPKQLGTSAYMPEEQFNQCYHYSPKTR